LERLFFELLMLQRLFPDDRFIFPEGIKKRLVEFPGQRLLAFG